MKTVLEQLREMTVVVADTGEAAAEIGRAHV